MAQITWNNAPDYDEWGYDSFWSCDDWMTWHKKLSEHFGEATATEIWNYAFKQTTNLSSNLDCNSFNSTFRAYVKQHNLTVPSDLVTKTLGTTTDVVGGALDTTSNVVTGVFGTVNSFLGGTNLKKTINIVLIIGGVLGVAYVYKAFKKQ
jgi:hypothetical protein